MGWANKGGTVTDSQTNGVSRASQWVGIIYSGIGIAAFLMGGLAFYMSSQVQHLQERAETNRSNNEKTADQARDVQVAEQVRNNIIEKDLHYMRGRQEMFHELWLHGKLKGDQP